jgi:hypothetical protein
VILFTEVDRWTGQRRWPLLLVGTLTLIQIGIGVRSIWY